MYTKRHHLSLFKNQSVHITILKTTKVTINNKTNWKQKLWETKTKSKPKNKKKRGEKIRRHLKFIFLKEKLACSMTTPKHGLVRKQRNYNDTREKARKRKRLIIESWQLPNVKFFLKPSSLVALQTDPAGAAEPWGSKGLAPKNSSALTWCSSSRSRENKDKP